MINNISLVIAWECKLTQTQNAMMNPIMILKLTNIFIINLVLIVNVSSVILEVLESLYTFLLDVTSILAKI